MKKKISLMLILMLIMSVMPVSVFADAVSYEFTLSADKTVGLKADDTVTVTMKLEQKGSTSDYRLYGAQNSVILDNEFVELVRGSIVTSDDWEAGSYTEGGDTVLTLVFLDITGEGESTHAASEICSFRIKIKDIDENITVSCRNPIMTDENINKLPNVSAGSILLKPAEGGGEIPVVYDLSIEGAVSKNVKLTLEQLQDSPSVVTKTYSSLNNYGTRESFRFKGIYLEALIDEFVSLKNNAKSITVSAPDGYKRNFNLDSEPLGVYWKDTDGNQMMLAWEMNGSSCDLKLVVGQIDTDHVNKPLWVNDVSVITVNASTTDPGSGTPGGYEGGPGGNEGEEGSGGDQVTETVRTEISVAPSVNNGTASSVITLNNVNQALNDINNARTDEGASVNAVIEINAESGGQADVSRTDVTLPKSVISALANSENTDITVKIKTDLGELVLTQELINMLNTGSSDSITISMSVSDSTNINEEDRGQIGERPVIDITISDGDKTISDLDRNRLRVGISYDNEEDENTDQLLAYYINEDGEILPVRMSRYDEENNRLLFGTVHLSLYAVGYNEVTFSDIRSHWAKNNIEFLAARLILSGKSKDLFDPEGDVTRAEYVTMLANSTDGITVKGFRSAGFDDVRSGAWYADYVNWAVANGIVSGYGDGNFGPDDKITREQMALMTDNFLKNLNMTLPVIKEKANFNDGNKISGWAAASVAKMQQSGIINGMPDGTFVPQGTATRAEGATIIKAYIEALLK